MYVLKTEEQVLLSQIYIFSKMWLEIRPYSEKYSDWLTLFFTAFGLVAQFY